MTKPHTIPLADVELALMTAKLRRHTGGRTALLAARTAAPLINVDCHRRAPRPVDLAQAASSRTAPQVGPMERGHIADVIERVYLNQGLAEVRRAFSCGIRVLRAESPWVLFGGQKGGAA